MRLFIGVPISEEIEEQILKFQSKYQNLERLRWVPKQNLHVTTLFIGDTPEEDLDRVITLIQSALIEVERFRIQFEKFCYAPKESKPKMIWASFRRSEEFTQLMGKLEEKLAAYLTDRGARKAPIPHITIARLKNFTHLEQINMDQSGIDQLGIQKLVLWESVLDPTGAIYTSKAEFEL